MRIQHNIMAMNSYRNYTGNNSALSKNLEKLSSGYKINRAGDDAAGLAISEKMRAQITGLKTAQSNAQSGINLVQTAEGALTEVHDMLNRMVELADQSANGTYDDGTDRANLQKEFDQLRTEINRIADASNFNGTSLLNGTATIKEGMTVTGPTSAANGFVNGDGSSTAAKFVINFSGASTAKNDGSATIELAGKKYTVELKKGDDAKAIGAAFETAFNKNRLTDEDAGTFTASNSNGTVTITASTNKAVKDTTNFKTGNITFTSNESDTNGMSIELQIGDTSQEFNKISVSIANMKTDKLGSGTDTVASLSIAEQGDAQDAVDVIKTAINQVSATRGDLGAAQNRLEHTINNLSVMTENIQDAESSIRDVDVAAEMMNYTKNNILVQSAQAMLAQANQAPQGVLQLLQ